MTSGLARIAFSNLSSADSTWRYERDLDENADLEADAQRVEQGDIAADIAGFFQRTHAVQARRRRQPDRLCQFDIGQARIALEQTEDLPACRIELHIRYLML